MNYFDTHIKPYVLFFVIKVEEQILSVTNDNQLFATSTQVSIKGHSLGKYGHKFKSR